MQRPIRHGLHLPAHLVRHLITGLIAVLTALVSRSMMRENANRDLLRERERLAHEYYARQTTELRNERRSAYCAFWIDLTDFNRKLELLAVELVRQDSSIGSATVAAYEQEVSTARAVWYASTTAARLVAGSDVELGLSELYDRMIELNRIVNEQRSPLTSDQREHFAMPSVALVSAMRKELTVPEWSHAS